MLEPKKKKKSLICYGNRFGADVNFAPSQFWGKIIVLPLLLQKPLGTCDRKIRITVEEV